MDYLNSRKEVIVNFNKVRIAVFFGPVRAVKQLTGSYKGDPKLGQAGSLNMFGNRLLPVKKI